jgi:IS5 family transposase
MAQHAAPGGLDHFKAYIWSAAVAHNLVLFARLKPA